MESLSQLLKSASGLSLMRDAEAHADRVLGDPVVARFRAKHPELDGPTLKIHLNRLYQYATEYGNCTNCPGLDRCPNDFAGHYTMLTTEEINGRQYIHDHKIACKKLLSRQKEDAVRTRIRSFYVDEHALKEGYSYNDMVTIDIERAPAVKRIMQYVLRTKEQGLQNEGLYLAGDFGTGKTFLISYMLYELAKLGLSGVIVYMPDFVEDLKAMFSEPQKLKDIIEVMKETDLLVFDDIGAENLNPWVRDHVMGSILNYRMNRKPTFYTSNYELEGLEKHFSFTSKDGDEEYKGRRIMDRIKPFVEVIMVKGENKRGRKS